MSHRRLYLVCYDIADPQRLARIGRFMSKRAFRVQYSVFVLQSTPSGLDRLLEELARMIDRREDDVRAYPLPGKGEVALLGQQMFPPDVMLIRDGHNVFRLNAKEEDAAGPTENVSGTTAEQ